MSQKDAYIAKKEAQFHELRAKIELVKAKAEKATAESRIKYNKQLKDLEAKHKDITNWFDKLRSASEDGFEAVKSSFESAWQEFSSLFNKN
ncbi:MAG: hypothetical protein A2161_05930 [Candidatus Schekmanbacteria bacterium RBG_13_48_7]|uniref:Coiled coil domain-containing protein n=1 Tax=Candidatus Schekmanbacteria bacterium RBG_13_48_7 TaxID=1817878 RepID=A0A1F7RSL2_9BACT|nr:MAG: hypothetical protein A2161_05930 [Candidatus Schekmanbacteria bacterium RBG_13_48_7]